MNLIRTKGKNCVSRRKWKQNKTQAWHDKLCGKWSETNKKKRQQGWERDTSNNESVCGTSYTASSACSPRNWTKIEETILVICRIRFKCKIWPRKSRKLLIIRIWLKKNQFLPAPNALKADAAALLNNVAGLGLRNGDEGAVISTSPAPPEFPVSKSMGIGGGGGATSCEPSTLLTAVWKHEKGQHCCEIKKILTHQ